MDTAYISINRAKCLELRNNGLHYVNMLIDSVLGKTKSFVLVENRSMTFSISGTIS